MLLILSNSHSNFPVFVMELVHMAAIWCTFAAQEDSLTHLRWRKLKFILKKPIVIATALHSCFTQILPNCSFSHRLLFGSSYAEQKVLLYLLVKKRPWGGWQLSLQAWRLTEKKDSFLLFPEMPQIHRATIHIGRAKMNNWNKRNKGDFFNRNCRGIFYVSKISWNKGDCPLSV